VGFMVKEMALEQVILLVFRFFPLIIISPALHTHFFKSPTDKIKP